jgi:hypothetical protein
LLYLLENRNIYIDKHRGMYTKEQIESLFGSKAVEYVQRKNTGGTSSSKGIKYEDIFAVYQLALLSKCVIECSN